MSTPHYAAVAARLLRSGQPAQPAAEARARGLLTIQQALDARRKRKRLMGAAGALGLVAASALAFLGLRYRGQEPVSVAGAEPKVSVKALEGTGASVVDSTQHRAALAAGAELVAGSRIETAAGGSMALHLSTGTELALEAKSWLTLQPRGSLQRFALEAGALSANVAKLAAGARFIIETPDTEVEVRGTQFHLSVLESARACAPGIRTRLSVREGVVEVRAAGQVARVVAGGYWPEACAAPTGGPQSREPEPTLGPPPAEPVKRGVGTAAPMAPARPASAEAPESVRATTSSALSAQTELFARASKAARAGQTNAALELYQELIQRYPSSALAENAVVERMRLLTTSSPDAARREAERYLKQYGNGFGKSEAERILSKP